MRYTGTKIHDQRQFRFVHSFDIHVRISPSLSCLAQVALMNVINGLLKFLASASYAIIYIYANELFPTNVRNTGMGICSMVARIGAIIGTFCNDYLVNLFFEGRDLLFKYLFRRVFGFICPSFSMELFR